MIAHLLPAVTLAVGLALAGAASHARPPTAESSFRVTLPPHRFADKLLPGSPFGINTALRPGAPDLEARLKAMQEAGIKWGRQDFTWRRIETKKGAYDWAPYDRLVEACHKHDARGPVAQVLLLRLRLDGPDAGGQALGTQ